MLRKARKALSWYRLKSGKISSHFKSISVDNGGIESLNDIIDRLQIDLKLVHTEWRSEYTLPDKIEPGHIRSGILEVPISIIWTIYFYNDSDWVSVQLIR